MGKLDPTTEQVQAFLAQEWDGPLVMLNLLRYREEADYSHAPDLAPDEPITGRDAYGRYGMAVLPILQRVGARIVYAATASDSLIGPDDESWDDVLLVRYPDRDTFLAMTGSPEYLAIHGHRNAALADSRLIPTRMQEL